MVVMTGVNKKFEPMLTRCTIDTGQLCSKSVSTYCDKPVCTRGTLWRQHYVTTSKENFTNSHFFPNILKEHFFSYMSSVCAELRHRAFLLSCVFFCY